MSEPDNLENLTFTPLSAANPGSQAEPGEPEQSQETPKITNAQLLASALGAGREAFCIFTEYSSPRQTLSDAACDTLGDAWGKVFDKRGIILGNYLGDFALEIGALMVTLAIARGVISGVKAEQAKREPVDVQSSQAEPGKANQADQADQAVSGAALD